MAFNVAMNDFNDHICKSWKELRYQTSSSDVTLACENQQIKAHKFVLSAMSPVLKDLFNQNPHQYPLIYLKGVKFSELFSILDYIYFGEVTIAKEQMNDFLSTASDLGIENLSNTEAKEEISNNSKKETPEEYPIGNNEPELKVEINDDVESVFKDSKTEQFQNSASIMDIHDKEKFACEQCSYKTSWKNVLKRHTDVKHGDVLFRCNQCTYVAKEKMYLRRHVKAKHEGIRYPCEQCDYKAMYKPNLKTHVLSVHEGFRYYCKDCDYSTAEKCELKNHIKSKHEGIRYPCSQCNLQFMGMKTLRKHLLNMHKPMLCKVCGYSATEKKELKKHMKKEHKSISHNCKQCNYQAPLKKSLRKHVLEAHNPTS